MIKEKAKAMAQTLGLSSFSAAEHWFKQFKFRHDIRVRALQGEASTADVMIIFNLHDSKTSSRGERA
jgi:hypothetical protein